MRHATLLFALGGAGLASAKNPLVQITELLTTFRANLKEAEENDKKLYDKYQCACKQDIPAGQDAIAEAENCIKDSQNTMDVKNALKEKMIKKIEKGEKVIADSNKQLEELKVDQTGLKTEWNKLNAELTKTISALQKALGVLKKGQAFLQTDKRELETEFAVIRAYATQLSPRMAEIMTPKQRASIVDFLQQPTNAAYASQTGGIIGILSNMEDTCVADQKDGQQTYEEELAANLSRQEATQSILDETTKAVTDWKSKKAAAEAAALEAKERNEKCTDTLNSEQQALVKLKEACTLNINDYQDRSKARSSEIASVSKALAVFTSSKVRAIFEKKKESSFLQLSDKSSESKKKMKKAYELVDKFAKGSTDPRMSLLSRELAFMSVSSKKQKVFAVLCKKIKAFQTALETEKEDWQNFVEDCKVSQADLGQEIQKLEEKIKTTDAEILSAETTISDLEDRITEKEKNIASNKESLGQTTAQRQQAHQDFLAEHENNAAAVEVLTEGARILNTEYAFLQQPEQEEFSNYKKQEGNKVVTLIENLKAETAQIMEKDVIQENEEQAIYDEFVKTTNETIALLIEEKVDAEGEKAKTEQQLGELQDKKKSTEEIRDEKKEGLEHKVEDCRFKIDTEDQKVKAIDDEVAVLIQVTSILQCNEK